MNGVNYLACLFLDDLMVKSELTQENVQIGYCLCFKNILFSKFVSLFAIYFKMELRSGGGGGVMAILCIHL